MNDINQSKVKKSQISILLCSVLKEGISISVLIENHIFLKHAAGYYSYSKSAKTNLQNTVEY